MESTRPTQATAGTTTDIYYVDVELFDTTGYGSVYIIDGPQPAIVDTGTGRNVDLILAGLASLDIDPAELEAVLLTHVHLDHAGGASPLVAACPNATIYVHESGSRFLLDPTDLWAGTQSVLGERISYYREPDPIPEDRIRALSGGESISLGERTLDVHRAPGHAFHQVVYHDRASDGVFTGDAAGVYLPSLDRVRHTSPPPGFDLEQSLADVSMLESLDPTALYYGHFGDQPTGNNLDTYRDRLRSWVERIAAKRKELQDDTAVIDHFVDQVETTKTWTTSHARGEERMNVEGVLHYLDQQNED